LLPVFVHPAALQELKQAKSFYDLKVENLGNLFLEEINEGISAIKHSPKTWRKYAKSCRRFLLKKFPYAIIYRLKNNTIQIIAFMHLLREPFYWRSRVN
jgi:toxin ParE1/3/4